MKVRRKTIRRIISGIMIVFIFLQQVNILFVLKSPFSPKEAQAALTETSYSMPSDKAFNGTGYDSGSGNTYAISNEVRLATSSAWWNPNYNYKKQLTLTNNSGAIATAGASMSISIDTKSLYDAGKLLTTGNDLRVVYSTTPGSFSELSRTLSASAGATISTSPTTEVIFRLQVDISNSGSSGNYYLYYGNQNASAPAPADGYSFETVPATFVAPFRGTTTAVVASGSATPTTATGAIRYSGGKSALSFNGQNNYVTIPASSDWVLSGDFTVETWVNINPGIHRDHTGGIIGPSESSWALYTGMSPGTSYSTPYFGFGTWNFLSGSPITKGIWHHLAAVRNGNTVKLYVDGISVATNNSSATQGTLSSFKIGNYDDRYFHGMLDEVRISNSARYTSNFTPQTIPFQRDSNTKLLLHLDENGDDPRNSGKAIDDSGNGNNGTITGAKYVSGLVGVDSTSSDTGNFGSQSYASHQGVFIEEGTTNLITNPSFENVSATLNWNLPYLNYATSSATFTPNVAKRNSAGPFAAGLMVQGDNNSASTIPDSVYFGNGNQISGNFYQYIDGQQGSIVLWYTPDKVPVAGYDQWLYDDIYNSNTQLHATSTGLSYEQDGGISGSAAVTWTVGTTYNIVVSWDSTNPISGSNHVRICVNGVCTFSSTGNTTTPRAATGKQIGAENVGGTISNPANGIIEGLTVYRRTLYNAANSGAQGTPEAGTNIGNGDEISRIYSSGTGQDPTVVTGSWDVVFALPTNASTGSLGSGTVTGQAWSHPHSSNLLYTSTTNTGGFMMNGTYTNDGWAQEASGGGTLTVAALATANKIFAGGYSVQSDGATANQGISYSKSLTANANYVIRALGNSDGTCSPQVTILRADGTPLTWLKGTTSSTRTVPDSYIFTFQAPATETYKIFLENLTSIGSCSWHQVELLTNSIKNSSFDVGWSGANPNIPNSWGTSAQPASMTSLSSIDDFHSGNSALRIDITNSNSNGWQFVSSPGINVLNFTSYGYWGKKLVQNGGIFGGLNYVTSAFTYQTVAFSGNSTLNFEDNTSSTWAHKHAVMRGNTSNYSVGPKANTYGGSYTGGYIFDDLYNFPLMDVSLTVTPESQANSTETIGLRVDGASTLTQPISSWTTASGSAKFKFTPRHNFDVADKFGFSNPIIASMAAATNNDYLKLYKQSSTVMRIEGNFNGQVVTADWNNPTFNAGTTYNIEMGYSQNYGIWFSVDGVEKARNPVNLVFGNVPTTAYFGSGQGSNQYDGTVSSFVSLTPSVNSTTPYYKFGSNSIKLIAYDRDDLYTIPATPSATATHTLSAYVYNGTSGSIGGTIDATVAQLASSSAALTTTYSDMGGGWWRLTSSPGLSAGTYYFGVQAKSGKTIYIDGIQLEQKAYATTYTDGSLGSDYAWTDTNNPNNSKSTRTDATLLYPNNNTINASAGSISFWFKPDFNTGDIHSSSYGPKGFVHAGYGAGWGPGFSIVSGGTSITGVIGNTIAANIWLTGQSVSKTVTFTKGNWYNVVFAWGSGNGTVFVNSSPGTSGAFSPNNIDTSFYVGGNYNYVHPADSVISDLRIYNSPLALPQVKSLYYEGLNSHSEGTEAVDRYVTSGTYTSPVLDLSANGQWGTTPITFTSSLKGGTATYYSKSSPDNSTWSDWAAISGNSIASDPRRYLQWKVDLAANSDKSDSPVVNGTTLNYVSDTTAPLNPVGTALGFSTSSTPSADLTSGNWNHYATMKFTWEAGNDAASDGEASSGIASYHVLLTNNVNAIPISNSFDNCYLQTNATTRQFVVGTSPSTCNLTTNDIYYLRLQTKDNSGNISNPVTLFTYKYENTNPTAVTTVGVDPRAYTSTNSYTMFWLPTSDVLSNATSSGLLGYYYKTGTSSGTLSQDQFTSGTRLDGITAYQTGSNLFYVRSLDVAGNVSAYTTASYYFNGVAPTAPTNLAVTPSSSSTNSFAFSWDLPASYQGSISEYRYSINALPSATNYTITNTKSLKAGSYATIKGTNMFYVVAVDEAGNVNYDSYASVQFTADTSAPGIPLNPEAFDNSIRATEQYKVGLTWDPPTDLGTGFAGYAIYGSKTATSCTDNFSSFSLAGTTGGTTYVVTQLGGVDLESTTYYFCIKAYDSTNQYSAVSETVSLLPTGKWLVSPDLTTDPAAAVKTKSATITWSTSRGSNSFVKYGTATGDYGNEVGSSDQVTSHSVKLTELKPGTEYYYKVLWTDEDGNQGTSSEFTFTTNSAPVASNVKFSNININSAYVTFTANHASTIKIQYGTSISYGTEVSMSTSTSETTNTVPLTNLTEGTTYHLRIVGQDEEGNTFNGDDYIFQTLPTPKISNVKIQQVIGMPTATLRVLWTSNTSISSILSYYPSDKLDSTKDQITLAMVTDHEMIIKNLLDDVNYSLIIKGKDIAGNEATEVTQKVKTAVDFRPPEIQNMNVESTIVGVGTDAKAQIIVSWDTDELATSQVEFAQGTGTAYGQSTQEDTSFTLNHIVTVTSLTPSKIYHLHAISKDKAGNATLSEDTVIITPKSTKDALNLVIDNLSKTFGFLKNTK